MKKAALWAVVTLAWASVAVGSPEHVIHQKGRMFSESKINIQAGEAVVFANDDTVPHNVFSATAGNEFNLGSQAPGTATPVTFTTSGEVQVLCGIHPRMRMQIKVSN